MLINISHYTYIIIFFAEIPYIRSAPEVQSKTSNSVTLRWPSWQHYMGEDYSLVYKVEYKEHGTSDYLVSDDAVPNNPGQYYTDYLVSNIELNKRYSFRVEPVLKGPKADTITIQASRKLQWIKTECDGVYQGSYTLHVECINFTYIYLFAAHLYVWIMTLFCGHTLWNACK